MDDFLFLCRAFGHLEDLVQGPGGNISVKLDTNTMVIKSSGVSLADVTKTSGYTLLRHTAIECGLGLATICGPPPSMETYFHSFLKKYVVHIHPTVMLQHLCGGNSCCVPYQKPGPELGKTIQERYSGEFCIHLANHGVIFTSDSLEDLLEKAHVLYETFRRDPYIPLHTFWKIQKEYPNEFVHKLSYAESVAYLPILLKHNIRKLTPDIALFLYDSVFIEDTYIFIRGSTKQKCLQYLEVLRSYCESVLTSKYTLTENQVAEVLHSPAEIFRKNRTTQ